MDHHVNTFFTYIALLVTSREAAVPAAWLAVLSAVALVVCLAYAYLPMTAVRDALKRLRF
jgi:hypothetical protein